MVNKSNTRRKSGVKRELYKKGKNTRVNFVLYRGELGEDASDNGELRHHIIH